MIRSIKLFANNNEKSIRIADLVRARLLQNGFIVDAEEFELGIAVGGDGSFLRMVKANNFRDDLYFIGINSGTLGFMQDVGLNEIDKLIACLKDEQYRLDNICIQETVVKHNKGEETFYSLNEIVVRSADLKLLKLEVLVNNSLLERFTGDGLLVSTPTGSTAYNLNLGGSIMYSQIPCLQLTPITPINSSVYHTITNSVILPQYAKISFLTLEEDKELLVNADGETRVFRGVKKVQTKIADKKIKVIRLEGYNFEQKLNEKLLNG